MKWYYSVRHKHTHVRVYMNGALCGTLTFRNEEFQQIMQSQSGHRSQPLDPLMQFIEEQ